MSGPKISIYSLTGRARKIVFGQIRCEQQSLACFSRTMEIIRHLQSFSGNFDQQIRNVQLLKKRNSVDDGQLEKLQSIKEDVKSEIEEIKNDLTSQTPHVSQKYQISEAAYAKKQADLKRLQALQKRAEQLNKRLDDIFNQDKENISRIQASVIHDIFDTDEGSSSETSIGSLQRNNVQNVRKIQESIIDDLIGVYSFEFDEEPPDTTFLNKKDTIRKNLSELLKDVSLPVEIINEIQKAIFELQKKETMQYLNTFNSITVKGIYKKIESFKHEEEQKKAEYKELTARYEALCSMAGEEPKHLPYSTAAKETVNAEIERLELLLVKQQEQSYISECVDEVMSEMGYDLIGRREVRKRSGKQFRNELFYFNEGTAVNVTYSPDGQISMELGGLAREDRIPSSEETEILIHDMESFCGEFADFERRMLDKGIVVGSRIALLPPKGEYASIINVNDYDIDDSTQISVMNSSVKRHKPAGTKVMRRDD